MSGVDALPGHGEQGELDLGLDPRSAADGRGSPGATAATSRLSPSARAIARAVVAELRGAAAGRPLPPEVRAQFEASLGADLSAVRIDTSPAAAQASAALGARAFAHGDSIQFADGQYQPDDPFGLHLLAHEVAHTQQQAGAATGPQAKLAVSTPGDAGEVEADRAADAMVAGRPAAITRGHAPTIQRQHMGYGEERAYRQHLAATTAPDDRGFHGGTGEDSYPALQRLLAASVEGPPDVGPRELLQGYLDNGRARRGQPWLAERVKFGPNARMTRAIRDDQSIVAARRRFCAERTDVSCYHTMGLEAFLRETREASLEMHFLGSFNIQVAVTPDQQALFVVSNSTGRASNTRNPITDRPLLPDRSRAEASVAATLHQLYYWTESIEEMSRRAAPPMTPPGTPIERRVSDRVLPAVDRVRALLPHRSETPAD